ncbi:MAG: cory-CC-star protein [Pseudohongiellaceae bacterium]
MSRQPTTNSQNKSRLRRLLQTVEQGLHDYYVTSYRRSFARAQRDEEDLFMMLVFAESLGIPNPTAFYTLELLPLVYDRFHEWHKRMGMERSPLDHISCC